MKILAFMGSPSKGGNTDLLLDHLLAAAEAAGAETEKVPVCKLNIGGCRACYACQTHEYCVQQDDMTDLYPTIRAADALVFATPIYWYHCSAQLKLLIDRLFCLFKWHDDGSYESMVEGKAVALLSVHEEKSPDVGDYFGSSMKRGLVYAKTRFAGHLNCPGVHKPGDVLQHPDALAEAEALGRKLAGM
jgi:multimeric flavodoxin WrbA